MQNLTDICATKQLLNKKFVAMTAGTEVRTRLIVCLVSFQLADTPRRTAASIRQEQLVWQQQQPCSSPASTARTTL